MNKQRQVLPKVLTDLRARVEVQGMKTYGRPLTTDDGRDALQDAYEEALDLAVYLAKLLMERDRFGGPLRGLDHVDGVAEGIRHIEGWAD